LNTGKFNAEFSRWRAAPSKPHIRRLWLVLAILSPAALPAHHSTTAEFDVSKQVTVAGTLTKVDWVNPHIVLYVEAEGSSGLESWKLESNPPYWFRKASASRADFENAIGKSVTVELNRAKDGTLYGFIVKITFPGGNSAEL
jgi:hypothetical protein